MAKSKPKSRKSLPSRKKTGGRICELEKLPDDAYQMVMVGVRAGAFDHEVAASLGVVPLTFLRWKRVGKEDYESGVDSIYSKLYQDLTKARGALRFSMAKRVAKKDPAYVLKVMSKADAQELGPGVPGWDLGMTVKHEGEIDHNIKGEIDVALKLEREEKAAAVEGAFRVFQQLDLDPQALLGHTPAQEDGITDEDMTDGTIPDGMNPPSTNGRKESSNGNGQHS